MTMLNFDTDLDRQGVTRMVRTEVAVQQTVVVTQHTPPPATAHLMRDDTDWSWSDLRDYVVAQITDRFGPFPRESKKEAGIFKSFLTRHGAQAAAIARYAFEVSDGYWNGAPISVTRFCINSDPYFSEPIKSKLVEVPVQGW